MMLNAAIVSLVELQRPNPVYMKEIINLNKIKAAEHSLWQPEAGTTDEKSLKLRESWRLPKPIHGKLNRQQSSAASRRQSVESFEYLWFWRICRWRRKRKPGINKCTERERVAVRCLLERILWIVNPEQEPTTLPAQNYEINSINIVARCFLGHEPA